MYHTYVHKIYQNLPLQDHPKFTQITIFWSDNIPSGNPAFQTTSRFLSAIIDFIIRFQS
jgi:hypothetical protein